MPQLSKSKILAHKQCPKRLWLQTFRPELAVEEPGARARIAIGNEVGEKARSLYPGGILIDGADLEKAVLETGRAMTLGKPVFEGTFRHDDVLVRADLLLPEHGGFRLVEVKSSTKLKEEHVADVSIQSWVIGNAGVTLTAAEVACIDTSFTYLGESYQGLFKRADLTQAVQEQAPAVLQWAKDAQATLQGPEPEIKTGPQCEDPYPCPFSGYCSPASEEPGFPVETLYRGGKLIPILREEGFNDLRDIPDERLDSTVHRRMLRCAKTGRPELDAAAAQALAHLPYPRFYMDFETLQAVIPLWSDSAPYAQIPFQWSCHIETAAGDLLHHAFLAEAGDDPRRSFAESLVRAISDCGPVFVFNAGFERARLLEAAELFADLRDKLRGIAERLVDLLPIARAHYYHPAMHGSWSLKAILPTVAPELAYDDLHVRDGGMAQEAYAEMIRPDTEQACRNELRAGLLAYCERDTFALVRLAHYFINGGKDR